MAIITLVDVKPGQKRQLLHFHLGRDTAETDRFGLLLRDIARDFVVASLAPAAGMSCASDLVHRDTTQRIIACFYSVYRELGPGFSEPVFRRAKMIALHEAGLRAEEEVRLQVHFHDVVIGTFFADIVVEGVVLVEIKALPELNSRAVGQLLNYLRVAGGGVGLLLNFGPRPEFSRKIVGNVEQIQG